jgi:hypothetical protein
VRQFAQDKAAAPAGTKPPATAQRSPPRASPRPRAAWRGNRIDTLKRIRDQTGTCCIGVRESSVPFLVRRCPRQPQGYSVDLACAWPTPIKAELSCPSST